MIESSDPHRWTSVRVGLFFVAALVWLIGVVFESPALRWIAIGTAVVALVIGQVIRRKDLEAESPDEGLEEDS